jgi:hypothetical protein
LGKLIFQVNIFYDTHIYLNDYLNFLRCGPGTWSLDLSSKHANSNFIGIDVEPMFPQEVRKFMKFYLLN